MHKRLALLGVLALFAGMALFVRDTSAASQTANLSFSGSGGTHTWLTGEVVCDECLPDILHSGSGSWGIGGTVQLDGQATWNPAPASTAMDYTASNLRHGATLDLADTLTTQPGTVTINYSVPIEFGVFHAPGSGGSCGNPSDCASLGWAPNSGETTSTTITESDTIPCTMPLPGESPRDCTKSFEIPIFDGDLFSIIGAKITLPITETVTVTGSGIASVRVAAISGGPAISNNTLTFAGTSPSTVSDPIFISCSQPVGNDLLYSLTQNSYAADPMTWSGSVGLKIEATALGFDIPVVDTTLVTLSGFPLGPINMSAPDQTVDLGPVLKNNVPPVANPDGPHSGVEGTPVVFDGSGSSSVCGFPTLVWSFSDGGVAYGSMPQHTFKAPGIYSGLLTATDPDGNTSTATFSVTISNLAPVTNAGPDMSTAWGVPVSLNGSAVDPGTDEQPFLHYSWDFGDGTPSASGGPTVTHIYSSPGTYTATLTACDPENACNSDTAQVVVRKRDVAVGYLGAYSGVFDTAASFSASLVDEFGQNVSGRGVSFTAGLESEGSATTNSSGIATTSNVTQLMAGSYTATASFAGDAFYKPATPSSGTFVVAQKNTILTYTGPLKSLPSKNITLSAVLTDSSGKPLAGRSVVFQLGAQGPFTTTTNAAGVASVSFKLNQKSGNYPLTVTYTPAGTDLPKYFGTSLSSTFRIGS